MGLVNDVISKIKSTAAIAGSTAGAAIASGGSGDSGFGSGGDRGFTSGGYDDTPDYYDYGDYGGYGGGSGKSPEDIQEETQAQIDNTVAAYRKRGKDLSAIGAQTLKNIKDQIEQNNALYKNTEQQNMQQIEWQPNEQRKQSTASALRDRMGNALLGSGLASFMEGLSRVDDMNDNQLINAWKQNSNSAYNNWFQSNEDLINDYVEQANAIKDELSKFYLQYRTTLSNINPLLATSENIGKSVTNGSASVGEGTDHYVLPKAPEVLASKELLDLYKAPDRASAVNPYTRFLVRPDQAVLKANKIGNTGTRNTKTAANKGYIDDLNVYQRRV